MAEDKTLSDDQMNEVLFMQLVMMFHGAAMQQMGKVINPITQKIERDLDQAKHSIDMLGMLEAKTKGNLNENEQQFLEHMLFELRMNYVDEVKKPPEEKPEEKKEEKAEEKKEDK